MQKVGDYNVFNMVGDPTKGPEAIKMHSKDFDNRDINAMEDYYSKLTGPTVVMQLQSILPNQVRIYKFIKEKR